MSDCCSPGSGFPTAASMEQISTNLPVVWEEICKIQQAILAAASQCQPGGGRMCTAIGGDTPMTFVSGVETVTVNTGGAGYFTDTPSVTFIPPIGSSGAGATGTVTTNGGSILSIHVTNGGSGYQPIPATLSITSSTGVGAVLTPLVDASTGIVSVSITNGGSGYTSADTITATRAVIPNPAYAEAHIIITSVDTTGKITSVAILNPGSGYQDSVTTLRIVSNLNPTMLYPKGAGFQGSVIVDSSGVIWGVQIYNTGEGYVDFPPYLVITDPGSGATTSVILNGTAISAINVLKNGSNYTSAATGNVLNPPTAPSPTTPAQVKINVPANTFGTNPNLYWQVWQGAATNKPLQMQMNSVITYFQGLGYTITRQTNPATGTTMQWYVCW
jgi:hypothetical protein